MPLFLLQSTTKVMVRAVEVYVRCSAHVATALQLTLLHQTGVGPFEALERQVPDSVVEAFQPEAPLAESCAALESFRHGVWAKHGWSMMLRFVASQGTPGASGGLRLSSLLGGPVLHLESTGASWPFRRASFGIVAPPEPSVDALEV